MIITIASMKDFFSRIRYNILTLLIVVVSLVVSGCTMTADNTLGSDIMPEGQVMVMRHLKIRGSEMVRYNAETATNESVNTGKKFFETQTRG